MTAGEAAATWPQLRAAALTGTGRRPWRAERAAGVDLTDPSLDGEQRLLAAAALEGARRRAGQRAAPGTFTLPPPSPHERNREAPPAAVQLLELVLAGAVGAPTDVRPLLGHWLDRCAAADRHVPPRLVVPILEAATSDTRLRDSCTTAIGERGRWLAAQRRDWCWASREPAVGELTPETFAGLDRTARRTALRALRAHDPARARELIVAGLSEDRAADRAAQLEALEVGLGPEDDDLLESALDDRAGSVRDVALALLDRRPDAPRARRLAARLRPLVVHRPGDPPSVVVVESPGPFDAAARRDGLPPGAGPDDRRRALVAAAPLAVWEEVTGRRPHDLVRGALHPDDLSRAWLTAAIRQRDTGWLSVLVGVHPPNRQLVESIPGPWPASLSAALVAAARALPLPLALLADRTPWLERLDASAVEELERWASAETARPHLARSLRSLVGHLHVRSSITEAFG